MKFKLTLLDPKANESFAYYDTKDSTFEYKERIVGNPNPNVKSLSIYESKGTPVLKKPPFKFCYIVLGLGCNFHCKYCIQQGKTEIKSSIEQARIFVKNFDSWFSCDPNNIKFELWGGEPLLHWEKFKILVDYLRKTYPKAIISTVSNGSLLDMEKAEYLVEKNIVFTVSHDGEHNKDNRTEDPFENPEVVNAVQYYMDHSDKFGISSVFTPLSYDTDSKFQYISKLLGGYKNFIVYENPLYVENSYNKETFDISPEKWKEVFNSVLNILVERKEGSKGYEWMMQSFIDRINNRVPLDSLYQSCGRDRSDSITVNLYGDILTCHDDPSKEMTFGNVSNLSEAKMNTGTHFHYRDRCLKCPLVHLCQGACMRLSGEPWELTCKQRFLFYSIVFSGVVYHITGSIVSKIETLE
jgi:uncharacterized protein